MINDELEVSSYRTFILYNLAKYFPRFLYFAIISLAPKDSQNKSGKYEKIGKYWLYCAWNCAITNAYRYTLSLNTPRVFHFETTCNAHGVFVGLSYFP